jgi:predicted dehydrogenase
MKLLFIGTDEANQWRELVPGQEIAFFDAFRENESTRKEYDWLWRDAVSIRSLDEGLDRFKPDFAVIGVPNYRKNNPEIEAALLEQGIPFYIHKFRVACHGDFEKTYAIQRKTGVDVLVGEAYRYNQVVLTVKTFLDSAGFGKPEFLKWDSRVVESKVWEWEAAYPNVALEDLALHHFSAIQTLTGLDTVSVYARSMTPRKGLPASGSVSTALMETRTGLLIQHTINWHNSMGQTSYLGDFSIDCEKGGVSAVDGRVFVRPWGEAEREIPPLPPHSSPAVLAFDYFRFPGKSPKPYGIGDFAQVIRNVHYALESAVSGLPVKPPRDGYEE